MSTLKHKGVGWQALTANELREGYSVWLTDDMTWTRKFSEALVTEDEDKIAMMTSQGEADEASNLVVGIYFIDVDPDSGEPKRYREKFRMNGPSIDTADLVEPK